jgi:hypothetical protein
MIFSFYPKLSGLNEAENGPAMKKCKKVEKFLLLFYYPLKMMIKE